MTLEIMEQTGFGETVATDFVHVIPRTAKH